MRKVSAEKKYLLLTDIDFYRIFRKYSDGKIDNKIIIQLVPNAIIDETNDKTRKSRVLCGAPIIPTEMSFDAFWADLKSFLSSRRLIRNWTAQKGYIGEDFEAIYDFGYVVIYPASATTQKVRRQDFKLVFDNWQGYINGVVSREALCESSRFTKYTISITHEYLVK